MNQIDDMLRDFRSDQPGPQAGAAARIATQAVAGKARRPRWRQMRVLAPAVGGAAFVAAALALGFGLTTGGQPSNALAAVSKALTPSEGVLHNVYRVNYETRGDDGAFRVDEVVRMHEFTSFDGGSAKTVRLFISAGPLDNPPTDEDSVISLDPNGKAVARSWVSGHVRTEALEMASLDEVSTAGRLRAALRGGELRVASTSGSTIVLEAVPDPTAVVGCPDGYGEVVVDAATFRPVSLVESMGCVNGTTVTSRQVISVEKSETLPDTPANQELVQMGDWPIGDNVPVG